jgi:hypothetical protein
METSRPVVNALTNSAARTVKNLHEGVGSQFHFDRSEKPFAKIAATPRA